MIQENDIQYFKKNSLTYKELEKYLTKKNIFYYEYYYLTILTQKINQNFLINYNNYLSIIPTIDDLIKFAKIYDIKGSSIDFMEKIKYVCNWDYTSLNYNLDILFTKKFKKFLNWDIISERSDLTDEFVLEFKYLLNLEYVTYTIKLHENTINLLGNLIKDEWFHQVFHKNLSKEFIIKNLNKIGLILVNSHFKIDLIEK